MKYARASILVGLVVVWSISAFAGERQDFIVNTDGSSVEQNSPRISVAGDGTFMITWMDTRYGVNDIFVQKFDSSGQPVGGNQRVNDNQSVTYHFNPAIAIDVTGNFAVVWRDFRNGAYPFDPDIFFQSFSSSGAPAGSNVELTTEFPDSTKAEPDISMAAWGNGVVVWADYRNRNWDIYGQLISSDGSLVGPNFRINDDNGTAQQHAPRVSTSPEGWFIVTWYDNRTGSDDIFVQRFDLNGQKLGVNFRVHSTQASRQAFPDIATDGAGHFTVVWVDWRNGIYPANPDIYARKFDTTYNPITAELRINKDGTTRAQREVAISADHAGNVAIVWADSTSASSWDIVGQMIDVTGIVRETNLRANTLADSMQFDPDVAIDGVYRYVTWVDRRNGNFDVFASITQYNDPHLTVTPGALQFSVSAGDTSAVTQQVVAIGHAGYNSLAYVATASENWISVSPATGITPTNVTVSVNPTGLQPGTYVGEVSFVDANRPDSGEVVPVRLDYTSPQLAVSPDTISLSTTSADLSTHPFSIQIANLGLGALNWHLVESVDWITTSSDSGTGAATVTVTLVPLFADTGVNVAPIVVDAGIISGSPDTVWVVMTKTLAVPVLNLSPDSIHFSAYALTDTTMQAPVTVGNNGPVSFNWTASVTQPWLSLSSDSGTANDVIQIEVMSQQMPKGTYTDKVVFESVAGPSTTDTLVVVLELTNGQPVIAVIPNTIHIRTDNPAALDTSVKIANSGSGALHWRALSNTGWLVVSPDSGTAGDQLRLTAPTFSLPFDRYASSVALYDVRFPGDITYVNLNLNAIQLSQDSILVEPITVDVGSSDYSEILLAVYQPIDALTVALSYDPGMISIDSFIFDSAIPATKSQGVTIVPNDGLAAISTGSSGSQSTIGDGSFSLGRLYFTAGNSTGQTQITPLILDTLETEIHTVAGARLIPQVAGGTIQLEVATAVGDSPDPALPREFSLSQNYPNPFNLTTRIDFNLPEASTVNLTIFNVLGQQIRTLVAGPKTSGFHEIEWDGRHASGYECPSGIYFYRLSADAHTSVQRMILSK